MPTEEGKDLSQYAAKEASAENQPELAVQDVQLGWSITYTTQDGTPPFAFDLANKQIVLNTSRYQSRDAAVFVGAVEAARGYGLGNLLRGTPLGKLQEISKNNPQIVSDLCLFEGLGFLRSNDEDRAQEVTQVFQPSLTYSEEYKSACAWYILSGKVPSVSPEVRKELEAFPVTKDGKTLLAKFSDGSTTLERRVDYYTRFVAPALDRLRELDRELSSVAGDSFIPSTDDSELEALSEEDIEKRVEPFIGGSYRGQVFSDVDWETMHMVLPERQTEKWVYPPADLDEQKIANIKRHRYTISHDAFDENSSLKVELLGSARPLSSTLSEGVTLHQDDAGCFTLRLSRDAKPQDDEGEGKHTSSFEFIRSATPLPWQKRTPTGEESNIPVWVAQTLSDDTRDFLKDVSDANITSSARALRVVQRVHKSLEYVNDSKVGDTYTQAGRGYFTQLEQLKKADCDVANFYALAQLRLLGIPCRMVTGYYVEKDSRFSFAAVAGQKHAWLEYWDSENRMWTPIDATPPAPPEDEDEEKRDGEGGGDELRDDMLASFQDFSEDQGMEIIEQTGSPFEWTEERLAQLADLIRQGVEAGGGLPSIQEAERDAIFSKQEGVDYKRWEEVRTYVEIVNAIEIPATETMRKEGPSTVGKEWEEIYKMILIAYRLPQKGLPRDVRESEGGYLWDPTIMVTDLLTKSDDPRGNRIESIRTKTERLPILFSNDMLLDLTASMNETDENGVSLKEAQKQFVMTDLYQQFRLNDRLRQRESELSFKPPYMTSQIFSIHGDKSYREQTVGAERMSIKKLVEMYTTLDTVTQGAGKLVSALEKYLEYLQSDPALMQRIRAGEVVKTMTIVSDGNLWCSQCGKESCSYQHDVRVIAKTQELVAKIRSYGVHVNALGFTKESAAVVELFKDPSDPLAARVAADIAHAIPLHHGQIAGALKGVNEAAARKIVEAQKKKR